MPDANGGTMTRESIGTRLGRAAAVVVLAGGLVVTVALTSAAVLYALGLVGAAWRSLA